MSNINQAQLGEQSYNGVLMAIRQKIEGIQTCDTVTGNELLAQAYRTLNESTTPILDLKEFTTNADKVASDDATLCDVVNFCRSKAKTGDLNFLINMCKEEHFKEMTRAYHPKPEETIKAFDKMFSEPSTVIEQGIKNGIFDSMKSNLLNILKKDLEADAPVEKLNETLTKGNLLRYSPIGISFEGKTGMVHLLENCIIKIDENEVAHSLNESEIEEIGLGIPEHRMMNAIAGLKYDPLNETFSFGNKWDFDCQLKDGVCTVNGQQINKSDLKDLLLESIDTYTQFPTTVTDFARTAYLREADNMMMLLENFSKVMKYDNFEIIRNLNEGDYVMFDKTDTLIGNTPKIISASDKNLNNKLFESYTALDADCLVILNESVNLFASQINNEIQIANERNAAIVRLNESIKESNKLIQDATVIRDMADADSPAYFEMQNRISKLTTKLNENLNELNHYKNEFGK